MRYIDRLFTLLTLLHNRGTRPDSIYFYFVFFFNFPVCSVCVVD